MFRISSNQQRRWWRTALVACLLLGTSGCVPGYKRSSGPYIAGIAVLFVVISLAAMRGSGRVNYQGAREPGRGGRILPWLFVAVGVFCMGSAGYLAATTQWVTYMDTNEGVRRGESGRFLYPHGQGVYPVAPGLPDAKAPVLSRDHPHLPARSYWGAQGLAMAGGLCFLAAALLPRRAR
jgi:hypothetical protein